LNSAFFFTTWIGILALVIGVIVAVVTFVMPFLVWGNHTRLQEMEINLTHIKMDVNDIKLTVEAIDAVLEDLVTRGAIGGETRARVEDLRSRRYSAMIESAVAEPNRKLQALRDPNSPEAIKAARKQKVGRWILVIILGGAVLITLYAVLLYKPSLP
jgi:hypothetical protein